MMGHIISDDARCRYLGNALVSLDTCRYRVPSSSSFYTRLVSSSHLRECRIGRQFGYSEQSIATDRQCRDNGLGLETPVAHFAQVSTVLAPAEHVFNTFSQPIGALAANIPIGSPAPANAGSATLDYLGQLASGISQCTAVSRCPVCLEGAPRLRAARRFDSFKAQWRG